MRKFEKTILAGFTVHKSEFGGYYFEDPEGFYASDDHLTEEEAWESADNHRMFGDE